MTNGKKDILIITGRYLPGYKDGGPVRSIKNLTDYLGNEYNFRILTADRDHRDLVPYPGVKINDWNRVGNADVFYLSGGKFSFKTIREKAKTADLVYVCGCFNDYSFITLFAKRIGQIDAPVVVAAMGLFSPLEFRRKYLKKKLYTEMLNKLGFFSKIFWSATSEMEINEIMQQVASDRDQFYIARDLPRKIDANLTIKHKNQNQLEVVWISRISPKKNLLGTIDILKKVKQSVHFTILGPEHDSEYWTKCRARLKELPPHIQWDYLGYIDSEEVVQTLKNYHVFLFPTLGENYGHVILEALSAGCPCVISDQTPWQKLEENQAGYVLPLHQKDRFAAAIDRYAEMTEQEFQQASAAAYAYAVRVSNQSVQSTGYRTIFNNIPETQMTEKLAQC